MNDTDNKELSQKIENVVNYLMLNRKLAITQLKDSDFEQIAKDLGCTKQFIEEVYVSMLKEEVSCINCCNWDDYSYTCSLMSKCAGIAILGGCRRRYLPFYNRGKKDVSI